MDPVEKGDSLVCLSVALQGMFAYPSFQRGSTSLREFHLRREIRIPSAYHPRHIFQLHLVELWGNLLLSGRMLSQFESS